jgi:hypothetical protein
MMSQKEQIGDIVSEYISLGVTVATLGRIQLQFAVPEDIEYSGLSSWYQSKFADACAQLDEQNNDSRIVSVDFYEKLKEGTNFDLVRVGRNLIWVDEEGKMLEYNLGKNGLPTSVSGSIDDERHQIYTQKAWTNSVLSRFSGLSVVANGIKDYKVMDTALEKVVRNDVANLKQVGDKTNFPYPLRFV